MTTLPAKAKRTGVRQLSISFGDDTARLLEAYRATWGLRSWGAVIRHLIHSVGKLEAELEGPAGGAQTVVIDAEPPKAPALISPDVHLLAWAVTNCHTLARRRLHRQSQDAEWWQHVQRICEKAGARSAGVLRASVPTEITDGEEVERA